jgi:predicted permease
MKIVRTIWLRILSLCQRRGVKREIDEELRFHLEQRTAENLAAGMTPEDAAREARRRFGNVQSVREECCETKGANFGEVTWQDVRFGLRMLRKSPGFLTAVLFILALGIGANTAVFSVANAVLLKPLPYREPGRIVNVWKQQSRGAIRTNMDQADFKELREQGQLFECVAAHRVRRVYLQGLGPPRHLQAEQVSPSLFPLLGVRPALGRGFLPEEEQEGNDHVVVLSDAFWRDYFAGSPEVIGKSLNLDGQSYSVIGVMPPAFRFPFMDRTPFWLPLVLERKDRPFDSACFALARLKPGVTEKQARGRMAVVAQRLVDRHPENAGSTFTVNGFLDDLFGDYRRMLLLSLGATGFVLLIACSNVANLLLVRAGVRQREVAVRLALGASHGRVWRQMLTESLVLSLAAGLLGLLAAHGTMRGLISFCPAEIPRMDETCIDTTVLLFSLSVSVITGLVFGLMPAWKVADIQLVQALKEGQPQSSGGRGWQRIHGGLVITQIAVSLVLLAGGALLIRSLIALQRIDLGFRPEHLLRVRLELPEVKYPKDAQRNAFFEQLLEGVRSLPGVQSAAIGDLLGHGNVEYFSAEGSPSANAAERSWAICQMVSPGYIETLGFRVLKGRTFTQADLPGGECRYLPSGQVIYPLEDKIVVDEKFARDYFPEGDPVGQRIQYEEGMRIGTIVGVVATFHDFEHLSPVQGRIYRPMHMYWYVKDVIIRSEGDPLRVAAAVRAQVTALDKEQAISKVETAETALAQMLAPRRFNTMLIGLSGGIALVLAAIGIYGLVSYSVSQRTHEIGVRMALGASRTDVTKLALRQGARLILLGMAVGILGSFVTTRLLTGLLFEVRPDDPVVLVCVVAALLIVAFAACYIPARRAAKIAPMEALRSE